MPPSAFVDSSVLFAAALSLAGSARDLIKAALTQRIDLVLSPFVLAEVERNLSKKAPSAREAFYSFTQSAVFRLIDPPASLVQDIARAIEPKDAPIVAGTLTAKADYLAIYDRKHLLAQADIVRELYRIVVCTPDELLARI